jgi:hypothetical protein
MRAQSYMGMLPPRYGADRAHLGLLLKRMCNARCAAVAAAGRLAPFPLELEKQDTAEEGG